MKKVWINNSSKKKKHYGIANSFKGELLSLKLKSNMEELKSSVPRPASGIPENALPGWEDVPLYDKLPMLDCPGNAIVFTGGKMGKVQKFEGGFDSNCNNEVSEYNSLTDPNLTNYYMRSRNLQHLKTIGKITENNDVICNALQFNQYRRKLNRFHLFSIYKELERREQEQDDRAKIQHAEAIVEQERKGSCDERSNVKQLKLLIEEKKHERNVANYQKIQDKFQRIKKLNELKLIILQQKKVLHNITIEQHQLAKTDLLRMRIIAFKRQSYISTERSRNHIKNYTESTKIKKMEKAQVKWQKQLSARRKKHERNVELIAASAKRKAHNIKVHKKLSAKRWKRILAQIAEKADNIRRTKGGKKLLINELHKQIKANLHSKSSKTSKTSLVAITKRDISEAVDTAFHFNSNQCDMRDSQSIYSTAKYLIENIIFMVNEDLNNIEELRNHVWKQIDEYFEYAKNQIIKKVSNIIQQIDNNFCQQHEEKEYEPRISFNKHDKVGASAMQDNMPLILKKARSRTPTPAGSLTSLLGVLKYDFLEDHLKNNSKKTYTKEQMIFAEHFLIKFKRLFIVGVEKKVFQAIELYKKGKFFSFNKKLLKIDRTYLINVMTYSILAYNINRYDFDGNIQLCISAISSDIIWELQNNHMRPIIDPKCMKYPKSRCTCCVEF